MITQVIISVNMTITGSFFRQTLSVVDQAHNSNWDTIQLVKEMACSFEHVPTIYGIYTEVQCIIWSLMVEFHDLFD